MYRHVKLATRTTRTPDTLLRFVFDDKRPVGPELPDAAAQAVREALGRAEFGADRGQALLVYPPAGPRVGLIGLGKLEGFGADAVRQGVAAMTRQLARARAPRLSLDTAGLPGDPHGPALVAALADGLVLPSFTFDQFKGVVSDRPDDPGPLDLTVEAPKALRGPLQDALHVAEAVNAARTLGATPPNVADPAYLASHCRKLARRAGLKCSVIDAARARQLGMGGLLAVGAGGSKPPRLIVLEWSGSGDTSAGASAGASGGASGGTSGGGGGGGPILLVGKAISFDTGGYSLKVGGSMKGMKYDKCGGMAVIGIMQAVAALKLKRRVVALIATAENMIDREAYRVDDILTLCNGVTVEVTNTDAEGRLVLADALAYGTKKYEPAAVIDLATLTGGVVTALGHKIAGGWCTDDALWQRVEAAAAHSGEHAWRMPLNDDYRKMMRADHADLHNSAPIRAAHPIQGAAFLSHFVGPEAPKQMPTTPWLHLDIAGTAKTDTTDNPLFTKGPTGAGVRLVTEVLRRW